MSKKTVVVGMSGGVDSSVCAYLLKEQGYNVIGITMQLVGEDPLASDERPAPCCGNEAFKDALRVAFHLGIPHHVIDFKNEFKENVIDYFIDEYLHGHTPNPCIACNRHLKWGSLLNKAKELGADYIATGHYARVIKLDNGRFAIRNSVTAEKDQTYALFNLTQEQLSHTLMPVGEHDKNQVREIAKEIGLNVASKPDSQEICFVMDNDYASYIERETNCPSVCGNFIDSEGNILGTHKGITHYTIGQRKGLGISLGRRIFVTNIDPDNNTVTLGENEDLFTHTLTAKNINFMGAESLEAGDEFTGKIRYNDKGTPCRVISCENDILKVEFENKVRAVTPGQALVLYKDGYVAAGGTIVS